MLRQADGCSFDRIIHFHPGRKPSFNWPDTGQPRLQECMRRTGAGFLLRSGAVGDNLIIALKLAVTLGGLF